MPEKTVTAAAILLKSNDSSFDTSADLLKRDNNATYIISAMLIGVPQCKVPGLAIIPTLSSISFQCEENADNTNNTPKLILLPTLSAVDIRVKTC